MTETAGADLTARQRAVLEVIRISMSERGFPPSIREIGDATGLSSSNSVAYQLVALERKGYLRREAKRSRAIVLADTVESAVCPTCGRGGAE